MCTVGKQNGIPYLKAYTQDHAEHAKCPAASSQYTHMQEGMALVGYGCALLSSFIQHGSICLFSALRHSVDELLSSEENGIISEKRSSPLPYSLSYVHTCAYMSE